jgi:hypothetical protein
MKFVLGVGLAVLNVQNSKPHSWDELCFIWRRSFSAACLKAYRCKLTAFKTVSPISRTGLIFLMEKATQKLVLGRDLPF